MTEPRGALELAVQALLGSTRAKKWVDSESLLALRDEYPFVREAWAKLSPTSSRTGIELLLHQFRRHLLKAFPSSHLRVARIFGITETQACVLDSLLRGQTMEAAAKVPLEIRDRPLSTPTVSLWVRDVYPAKISDWIEDYRPEPLQVPPAPEPLPGFDAPYLPLGHPGVTAERFGRKAAVLSELARSRVVDVPEGWCIPLLPETLTPPQLSAALNPIWDQVKSTSPELIVRSSASVEDRPNMLFAGRFESVPGVKDRTGLTAAARTVFQSLGDLAVRDYLSAHELTSDEVQMAVLIQRQVTPRFAGVAFVRRPSRSTPHRVTVELIDGDSGPLLRGAELGARYELIVNDGNEEFEHQSGPEYDLQLIIPFLSNVFDACKRIADFLGCDQDVEWVWDGASLWIVQARELAPEEPGTPEVEPRPAGGFAVGESSSGSGPELRSLSMSKEWGLKGAAEAYFQRELRGAPNALLIAPHERMEVVVQELANREEGDDGTVLRFSHRATVGLPREFVPPRGPVVETFLSIWGDQPEWMGIVSDYLYIASSFEAYVSPTSLLVEHVPGNWESGNELQPDLFLFTRERGEFWRFNGYRDARLEIPGAGSKSMTRRVPPLSLDQATAWVGRFVDDFRKIRNDFDRDLPVNVHFVSNPQDEFHFLNIRPTRNIDIEAFNERSRRFKQTRMFRVEDPDDVANWDGVSKILVDSVADRGNESRIAGVARALVEAGVTTVYCTFGLLSHPAIVLREFDLRVEPLYINHDVSPLGERW